MPRKCIGICFHVLEFKRYHLHKKEENTLSFCLTCYRCDNVMPHVSHLRRYSFLLFLPRKLCHQMDSLVKEKPCRTMAVKFLPWPVWDRVVSSLLCLSETCVVSILASTFPILTSYICLYHIINTFLVLYGFANLIFVNYILWKDTDLDLHSNWITSLLLILEFKLLN